MTLLEALNLALRSTGETPVTAIDSQHPQVKTILAEIHDTSMRIQRRGWWFNQGERTLEPIPPGQPGEGEIDTSRWDKVVPIQRSLEYYSFGGRLIDRNTGNPVRGPVWAKVRWVYPTTADAWDDMPHSFTDYVAAAAALTFASNYDADPLQIQKLERQSSLARIEAQADNIRYSKTNLYHEGSAGQALHRAWGGRYGTYR